jgi:thiosulfate/3-mercaptopyruvate sulfurtransferase
VSAAEPEPEPEPGDFTARPGALPVLDADGAAAVAKDGVLLDARAAERYRGEVEPVDPVAGHIPGAVSAPTLGNVGVDGRFLPPPLLRERFAGLGATDADDVGVYCGSGVTAAHEVLALTLAGVPAALYVGSWSNWVHDHARPVATTI